MRQKEKKRRRKHRIEREPDFTKWDDGNRGYMYIEGLYVHIVLLLAIHEFTIHQTEVVKLKGFLHFSTPRIA